MNFIRQILDIILGLFGGKSNSKPKSKKSKPHAQPATTTSRTKPVTSPPEVEKPSTNKIPVIPLTEEVMSQNLNLGYYDTNAISKEKIEQFIKVYHKRIIGALDWQLGRARDEAKKNKLSKMLLEAKTKLRSGDTFSWVDLKPNDKNAVKTLQTFLVNAGIFPPNANIDGFFGYATQAGVRLFQEYERVYGNNPNCIPNGLVDKKTWVLMKGWQQMGKTAEKWTRGRPSPEYNKWMQMLRKGRDHYLNEPNSRAKIINEKVEKLNTGSGKPVDTFKIQDWNFDPSEVHLIGIRRNESSDGTVRKNDDLFILLINGMVFKFWGSTDPNQKYATRSDEAFLVEGQHKFRFGWHKITNEQKLYQGLNPYERGVLVFRDIKNDNRLTEEDIRKGIDNAPNQSINIHWSGIGEGHSGTWSTGCQVLASKNYIDNHGTKHDCSGFSCGTYGEGSSQNENNISKTLAAYNMFTDLILCFQPKRVDYIYYTLARDENLAIDEVIAQGGDQIVSDSLRVFNIPNT